MNELDKGSHSQSHFKAVIFDMGGVFLPDPFQKFQADFETLMDLPRGAVSNILVKGWVDGPWGKIMTGQMALPRFARVVESCVLGYSKPHLRAFTECLRLVQVSPEQAVFLDDLTDNVLAARNLGITALKVGMLEIFLSQPPLISFILSAKIECFPLR
ncbi:bifunctional epoxide hydrolase 2 [Elysia marginata]|uniref:Bifunctional epoxide hydrolase 2 n=1 Tax=Elysia marginata TaxID=1093978 RepID=A0AAV4G5C5_9GAST|nr:bifunctional epoxide hydrolase 2 [Elysia marginata]